MAYDLIKIAGTCFVSSAAAVAIAVTVFGIWMPREFDTLKEGQSQITSKIDALSATVSSIQSTTSNIELTSAGVANDVKSNEKSIAYLTSLVDPDKRLVKSVLMRHMSQATIEDLQTSGDLKFVRGAVVNGNQYLFVDSGDMQKLNNSTLSMVRSLSEQSDVTFQPWFVGQYPGAHVDDLSVTRKRLLDHLRIQNPSFVVEGWLELDELIPAQK